MNVISLYPKNSIFYQKLFSLVLPIAFQQFMLAAVSASDALMLGFVSQNALSAVSLAGQITFVFNLFMGGLTMGTSILAAQYYGKGDFISIEKIFAYVTKVSMIISTVFFLASLFIPQVLMQIFTNDPLLLSEGASYLQVVSSSYLFTGLSQITLCILKNTNFAVKSMIIGSCTVVVNIFLMQPSSMVCCFFQRWESPAQPLQRRFQSFWKCFGPILNHYVSIGQNFVLNICYPLISYWKKIIGSTPCLCWGIIWSGAVDSPCTPSSWDIWVQTQLRRILLLISSKI